MTINYDIWLMLLSLTASTFFVFVTFSFVDRLYRSTPKGKAFLLPIYSFTVGNGLWGIHFINWMAFHSGIAFEFSIPFLLASWFAALFVGFVICYIASKKIIPLKLLLLSGTMAGLGGYAMYYWCVISLNFATNNVAIRPLWLAAALALSVCVSILVVLTFSKIKEYSGKNTFLIKLTFSFIMAVSIIGLHVAFGASIVAKTNAILSTSSGAANKQMLAGIISLANVCLFLLVVAVAILYDKYSKNTFKFNTSNNERKVVANALAYKDALTQLPNLIGFQHQLEIAAERCTRGGSTIAIAYIHLDHFKSINNNYGHLAGDTILTTVAQRLQAAVRGCDLVARAGGNEFVALIEETESNVDIVLIVDRFMSSIKKPFLVDGQKIEISCSIGIAVYPKDSDLGKLLICADAAMLKAKQSGKNQFKFFDAETEPTSDLMLEMQHDLSLAIENKQFILEFQPIVDCKTQLPVGAEALIRWNHPTKGKIQPNAFIPEAERFGLVNQINDWVIEESIRTVQSAKYAGIDLNISINLTRHQFRNPNLVSEIKRLMQQHDVPASNLTFEIKEAAANKNETLFKLLLAQFKAANIKVALDDFGMQPFTLTYLQDLNIDELKLDKVFLAGVRDNIASRTLVEAIIRLAHALNFNVVAEGVETEAQRKALVDLGCNHMQGFLYSKPVPEGKLFKLFKHLDNNFEAKDQLLITDYQM